MGEIYRGNISYGGGGGSEIDDTTTANNKTWSSNKISTELDTKLESIPIANSSTLGGVKIGSNIDVAADGTISTHAPYSLPTASTSTKGGITIFDTTYNGLYMSGTNLYLRTASATQKGGIYVGKGLNISSGTLSASVESDNVRCHAKQTYNVTTSGTSVTIKVTDSSFVNKAKDKLIVYIAIQTYAQIIVFPSGYNEVSDGIEIYGEAFSMSGSTEEYTPSFNSLCSYWYLNS